MKSFFLGLLFFPLLSFSQSSARQNATRPEMERANRFYAADQYDSALFEVNRLIATNAKIAEYYDLRGCIRMSTEHRSLALADFSKALSIEPGNWLYFHHRASVYYLTQHPDEAIADNNKALRLASDDSTRRIILVNRGAAYIMKRDFNNAHRDYLEVLRYDSTDAGALINMGSLLDDMGRDAEAVQYLEKAIRYHPNDVGGYVNLAFRHAEKGDYEKALAYNNKVIAMDPGLPMPYNNRGYVKYRMKDYQGALEDINKSLELYPQNAYAYRNRALVYLARNENARACDDLQTAKAYGFAQMYGDEVTRLLERHCR